MRLAFAFVGFLATYALAQGVPIISKFDRLSVLTPAGPDEPRPEVLASGRRLLFADHRLRKEDGNITLLAKSYGTTLRGLQATNNNEFILIYPGMKITVLNRDGQLYEVKKASETLDRIISRYKVGTEERRKLKELVVRGNNLPGIALLAPYELERGQRIMIPGVQNNYNSYLLPFESQAPPRISSRFGNRFHPVLRRYRYHEGLDIPKPYGTPVYSSRSGRVVEAGWHEGYGQLIEIRHFNGESTRYGHLSKMYVKPGDVVQRGKTMIGRVGSTGISTGSHLHFEVRDSNGRAVDPRKKLGQRH